jgi:hypothetical protein
MSRSKKTLTDLRQQLMISVAPNMPVTKVDLVPPKPSSLLEVAEAYLRSHWEDDHVAPWLSALAGRTPSPTGDARLDEARLVFSIADDAVTNGYSALGEAKAVDVQHAVRVAIKRVTGCSMANLVERCRLVARIERKEVVEARAAEKAARAEVEAVSMGHAE